MKNLVSRLGDDYSQLNFVSSEEFCWSPHKQQVSYHKNFVGSPRGQWTLLHELGHALLNHQTYASDLELIHLEAAAWEQAKQLATKYEIEISEDHIQDCMDTYRDWLHQRSTCPSCGTNSLQQDQKHYKCFNCGHSWSVSSSRFCRPYRLSERKKTSPAQRTEKAMFL